MTTLYTVIILSHSQYCNSRSVASCTWSIQVVYRLSKGSKINFKKNMYCIIKYPSIWLKYFNRCQVLTLGKFLLVDVFYWSCLLTEVKWSRLTVWYMIIFWCLWSNQIHHSSNCDKNRAIHFVNYVENALKTWNNITY